MGREWRLIVDGHHEAAFNMALDEAIMRAHVGGKCLPTLRLYGWERPAVSLGYFQKLDEDKLDLAYCHEAGISVVRRLTGGRAVLHGHDLTFSIVVRENELPNDRRGMLESHRWLVGGVVAALRNMGLDARLGMAGRSTRIMQSADCFAHAAACDVVVGNRKVAGAAQVRKSGVILEQGSMPFRRPAVEPARLFRSQYEESQGMPIFPEGLKPETLEEKLVRGFQESIRVVLVEGTFLENELLDAANLAACRFGTPAWTFRRQDAGVDNNRQPCYTSYDGLRGGRPYAAQNSGRRR